jgi:N-acetylmuramoyl-L-alanine amidase
MSIIKSVRDTTHVVVDLPGAVNKDQYSIYTLPADPKTKSPFQIVFDVQRTAQPSDLKFLSGLKGKVVAIDPGHGGSDPGAIGVQGTREKQVNLNMAIQVKANLEKAGAKVLMTRETDVDVSSLYAPGRGELQARTMFANENQADVFISIHHNAAVRPTANGTSTYYYLKTVFDGVLAQSLQEAMLQEGGLADFGVRTANFYVVKNVTMPAALLEIGFLSNFQEEQILTDPAFQKKLAQGIVTGLDRFFIQAAKMRGDQ